MKLTLKKLSGASIIAAFCLSLLPVAYAADPIGDGIKARQAGFQLYKFYAGHLFAMAAIGSTTRHLVLAEFEMLTECSLKSRAVERGEGRDSRWIKT